MTKVYDLIAIAYRQIIRPLVVEKVQSSDPKWDDFLLSMLDKLFDYKV